MGAWWADYPIGAVVPTVQKALAEDGCAVLSAPTGSGKSTVLPLTLLNELWLRDRKILMLEPRRIATYAVAAQLADNLGTELGGVVGYRMRLERRVSSATRLEVVTEGVLTRRLQHDPELADVGLVIFDEFHERSLQADLGLALALEVRNSLRDDLRILVMSATLECERLSSLLAQAPVIRSEGRSFPVAIRYFPRRPELPLVTEIARLVLDAYRTEPGSILVFLPGEAEIRALERLLTDAVSEPDTIIAPLYGRLDNAAQRRAILPCRDGRRKIVLATSIAESSLTIDGVRIVIDSGLTKVACFAPGSGLAHLETIAVSQAAATQRAGRAGRTEPGIAWRLWSSQEEARRDAMRPSEILYSDLSSLALELAAWGVRDPATLAWLDPPPSAAWQAARALLLRFKAIDEYGAITAHGRRIHATGLGVRAGHLAVSAVQLRMGRLGCRVAGLLDGFDFRHGDTEDFELALKKLDSDPRYRQALRLAMEVGRRLNLNGHELDQGHYSAGALLALAFPDRIARRRGPLGDLRYMLAGGRGAEWRTPVDLSRHEWLVALELEDRGGNALLRLAAPVEPWALEELLAADFKTEIELTADPVTLALEATERRKLGAIVWNEKKADAPERAAWLAAIAALLRKRGLSGLRFSPALELLRRKVGYARRSEPEADWPDFSDEGILAHLEKILDGFLPETFSKNMLTKIDWFAALDSQLDYARHRRLALLAPDRITLENGRDFKVDYATDPPSLAAKLQFFFGVRKHPSLADGKLPLTVRLLSPAGRPVQITDDLPGFWQGSYKLVRSELRGRYPKHDWPENP